MKITDYKKRFGADPELLEVVFHRYRKLVQLTISQQRCGVFIFDIKCNYNRIFNNKVQCLYLCLYLYSVFVLVSYRTYLNRCSVFELVFIYICIFNTYVGAVSVPT